MAALERIATATRMSSARLSSSTSAASPSPHVGYGGGGPHVCLGRHLAALELPALLQAVAGATARNHPRRTRPRLWSNFINGIKHMPVRFRQLPADRIAPP
jgi:cholest-4-en-3-one 26-monooxygenase